MKGTKELKTNKGITLIALVITIIVMLILVAVTISMAVNGGLFEYASNAGAQTNAAIDAEQEFANLEAGMTVDQLIDKYTQNSNGGGDVCGKCTDGYITGYVCDRYGDNCIDVSTNYAEEDSDIYICSSCGYWYGPDPTTSGLCDECGSELVYKKIYCLDMCGHCVGAVPQKGNYPCPYCSVEGTITFRINGALYRAGAGMTWRQWIEATNYYSGSYRIIGDKVGVGSEEVKYVCDAGEAEVSADDPIDQDVDYDEVYW